MVIMSATEAWPAAGQPFTVDELDLMPDDGRRYELLDGVLIVSPRPRTTHQEAAAELLVVLRAACPPELRVFAERRCKYRRLPSSTPTSWWSVKISSVQPR